MRKLLVGEREFTSCAMRITGEEPEDKPFPRPWVELRENNYGVHIDIESYGCRDTQPGFGGILHLEVAPNGYVRLYIWGDITSSEPTHVIDLEGASEEFREEEEDAGNA